MFMKRKSKNTLHLFTRKNDETPHGYKRRRNDKTNTAAPSSLAPWVFIWLFFNHRTVEVGKGLETTLSPCPSKSAPADCLRAFSSQSLNTEDGDFTASLGNLFPCLTSLTELNIMFRWKCMYFNLCPLPLILSMSTTEKSLALSSLLSLVWYLIIDNCTRSTELTSCSHHWVLSGWSTLDTAVSAHQPWTAPCTKTCRKWDIEALTFLIQRYAQKGRTKSADFMSRQRAFQRICCYVSKKKGANISKKVV